MAAGVMARHTAVYCAFETIADLAIIPRQNALDGLANIPEDSLRAPFIDDVRRSAGNRSHEASPFSRCARGWSSFTPPSAGLRAAEQDMARRHHRGWSPVELL